MKTLGKILIGLLVVALVVLAVLFITVLLVDDFDSIPELLRYLLPPYNSAPAI